MIGSKVGVCGKVTAIVRASNGRVKRFAPRWWERLLGLPGRPMAVTSHNVVTDEGDALIADRLRNTPTRTAFDQANAAIGVGTGFAAENKSVDTLVAQTGTDEPMDAGYPQTKGAWGAADDNVLQFRATFEAGDLDATGIDEALLGNGTDTLAYAQITPAITVAATDTLEITWELAFLGS